MLVKSRKLRRQGGAALVVLGGLFLATPGLAQNRETQAEDQIYRQLLGQNPNAPGRATPPPASATPGQDARATDQIFQQLMGQNPNSSGAVTPPPPSGTPGQDARATDQILRELTTPSR